MKQKITVKEMALVGVMTALVFAGNWLRFTIPTSVDATRIHLGNSMCLLSGFVLGPVLGGLASGFGAMFYDFTDPLFVNSAPFTFVFKFAMAFICGKIAYAAGAGARGRRRNIAAALCGAFSYVVLYLAKGFFENYFFLRMELEPVLLSIGQKAVVSSINAALAVAISVPLAAALRAALGRANLFPPAPEENRP